MNMQQTLGQALSDPRLAQIAGDAIRDMDLTKEPMWNQTLAELNNVRDEYKAGDTVTLTVFRNGQEVKVDVVLSEATASN